MKVSKIKACTLLGSHIIGKLEPTSFKFQPIFLGPYKRIFKKSIEFIKVHDL